MNTHELLELASLDALGLLEPDERDAFEKAFKAAPPALQAQIRREQTRLSRIDALLPQVEAPLGLRARVLAAVREAIHAVTARPAVAGRIIPELAPSRGVSPVWRAFAVGALAAALVLGFTTLQLRNESAKISQAIASNTMSDVFLREFGSKFDQSFFDANTRFVKFSPTTETADSSLFKGKAVVLFDPVNAKAQFYTKDLPTTDGTFELVIVDEAGKVVGDAVLTFRPSEGIGREVIKTLNLQRSQNLAIRRLGDFKTILASTSL